MIVLPRGPGAIAALALWTAVTMAEGERGIAQWFPKLPLFGSLLAASTILVRWYALISLATPSRRILAGAAIALAASQAAAVAFGWISRPADEEAVRRLAKLTSAGAIVAMVEGVAALVLCGLQLGPVIAMVLYLLIRVTGGFVRWRFGGLRGRDLEAYRVLAETVALALMASFDASRPAGVLGAHGIMRI
jgi:cobalamin synthase